MRLLFAFILLLGFVAAETSDDEAAILAGHERARKAHLTGDANLLASRVADKYMEAGRGGVREGTKDQLRQRFTEYFKVTKYSEWRDIYPPKVTISSDGKTAWMIVAIHAEVTQTEPGSASQKGSFDSSWISILNKIDGEWKMVAISSSVKEN